MINRTRPLLFGGNRLCWILAPQVPCKLSPEIQGKRIKACPQGEQSLFTGGERSLGFVKLRFDFAGFGFPRRQCLQFPQKLLAARMSARCVTLVARVIWNEDAHLISCVRIYCDCRLNQLRTHVIACMRLFAKLLFWSAESRKEASPWSTAHREGPDAGKTVMPR